MPMTARPKIFFVAMQNSVHAARWIEQAACLDYECHVFPLSTHQPHSKLANVTLHIPTLDKELRISLWKTLQRGHFTRAVKLAQLFFKNPGEAFRRVKNRIPFGRTAVIVDMSASIPAPIGDDLKINLFSVDHVLTDLSDIDERFGRPANESDETALRLHGPEVLAALIEELKPDLIQSMEFQHAGYLVLGARDRIAGALPAWLATNWGQRYLSFRQMSRPRLADLAAL